MCMGVTVSKIRQNIIAYCSQMTQCRSIVAGWSADGESSSSRLSCRDAAESWLMLSFFCSDIHSFVR